MAGMLCGVAGAMVGWKANAETIAITGGTVALGDGSQPIPDGMVVIRDGRIVAAGGMKMKLPAGTQVIDATGKWVTPGIVAGFSRLGLADVDLTASREDGGGKSDTSGTADDTTSDGPFNAAIDVVPAINPMDTTIAVNRADGVTRAVVAPTAGKSIFAGQGAVIDTGRGYGCRSRRRGNFSSSSSARPGRRMPAARVRRPTSCSATPFAKPPSSAATRLPWLVLRR